MLQKRREGVRRERCRMMKEGLCKGDSKEARVCRDGGECTESNTR